LHSDAACRENVLEKHQPALICLGGEAAIVLARETRPHLAGEIAVLYAIDRIAYRT